MPRTRRQKRFTYRDKVDASGATQRSYFVNDTHMASVRVDAGATPRERKRAERLAREYAGATLVPARARGNTSPPSGAPAPPPPPPASKPAAQQPAAAPVTWDAVFERAQAESVPPHVRITLTHLRHRGATPARGLEVLDEYAEALAGTAEIKGAGDYVEHLGGIR